MTTTALAQPATRIAARPWAHALRIGLIGGVSAVLMALIGMIEAFAKRSIIAGVIDLGTLLILGSAFLSGLFAARAASQSAARTGTPVGSAAMVGQGALAGLVTGLLLALLAAFINAVPEIRDMFINATRGLVQLLTFGMGVPAGAVLLVALSAIVGALAGLFLLIPVKIRRSLAAATMTVILVGLMQDLLKVTFQNWPLSKPVSSFLFASNGLTIPGAVALFVLAFAISWAWNTRGAQARARIESLPLAQRRSLNWGLLFVTVIVLAVLPWIVGLFFSEVLVNVGLYVLMALGLNIVVGFAGLLDLGYVAFYAIGAYTVALLTSTSKEIVFAGGLPFWVALPFAIVMAMLAGAILGIPVLKIRGDYLAIVTLGFGEIIRLLALSDFLKPILGGSRGVELIPKPAIGPLEFATPQLLYYLILAGCLIAIFISFRLKDSRQGRAWMAMREDEDVAQTMGINLVNTKLLAFIIGASFAGIAGAVFASKLAIIYPHSFNLLISILVLAVVIIGGMGSIPGVILGALVLVGLPELLREFADYRLLLYGAALVLMMLVRPEGLWPEKARQRELHEAEEEAALSGPAAAEEELAREGAAG
jgi:branched-chain amino acid transport system permease protein